MPIADNHIHTRYSPDGREDPEVFVREAIDRKFAHLTFTEHVDLLYCDPSFVMGDLDEYFFRVRELKKMYADKIYIGVGLEVGYTSRNRDLNAELLQKYNPDYIIDSVHEVTGADCYFPAYYADKTPQEAVLCYLAAVRESLDAPYPYHTVGHLGYVCRKAPYDLSLLALAPEETDDILRTVIRKNKILEINTSCNRGSMQTVPAQDVLLRYAQLGGTRICFASDAHCPQDIGRKYDVMRAVAHAAGFRQQIVVENGKEAEISL